jgi:sulfate-transporting ATPase
LGRTFQSIELFDDTTVLDNIRAGTSPTGLTRYVKDTVWPREPPLTPGAQAAIDEFHLTECLDLMPASLDYWLRRAVGIARSLAMGPSILILDEPAAGSDSQSRAELRTLLHRVTRSWNVGMLIIEHDVDFIFGLCDRIVALDRGRVIAAGTSVEVRNNPAVIASYLGTSASTVSVPTAEEIAPTVEHA